MGEKPLLSEIRVRATPQGLSKPIGTQFCYVALAVQALERKETTSEQMLVEPRRNFGPAAPARAHASVWVPLTDNSVRALPSSMGARPVQSQSLHASPTPAILPSGSVPRSRSRPCTHLKSYSNTRRKISIAGQLALGRTGKQERLPAL